MCSAKMKEGKILASNRLVESCTLYLVCIAWRLELQKVQNWIWFSGKWETWTLWEGQSSVRSLGKALAWWLPKVCASICCQVLRPVFSIWCTCWFWVLNLHNISNIFPLSPSVEFLILQFSKVFSTSELILSTFTVGKQSLSSTLQRSQTILSSIISAVFSCFGPSLILPVRPYKEVRQYYLLLHFQSLLPEVW